MAKQSAPGTPNPGGNKGKTTATRGGARAGAASPRGSGSRRPPSGKPLVSSQKGRGGLVWILVPALLGVALVAAALVVSQRNQQAASQPIDGVQQFDGLSGGDHTTDDVDYPQTPPVGGKHDPVWAACDGRVYTQPVREENAVHSLEHGAVWITYTDAVSESDVADLASRVEGQPYTFLSPIPSQPSPIMLTAWSLQMGVDKADDSRIDQFLTRYRQGPQTPEPGATCAAADGSPMPN